MHTRLIFVALFPFLFISNLFADGDVIIRPATSEEKQFIVSSSAQLKNAVSKLPQGWEYRRESPLAAEDKLRFAGKEEYAIEVKYNADLHLVDGVDAKQAAYDKVVQDNAAAQAKLESLMHSIRKKAEEGDKARQDGNREAFEKARAEMDTLQKEHDAILEGGNNPYQNIAKAQFELYRDRSISLSAVANSLAQQISGTLAPLEAPGAALAVRTEPSDKSRPSRALVLYGTWDIQRYGEGSNQSAVARRTPTKGERLMRVFNVAVIIEADRERIDSLVQSIDAAGIQKLIAG